MKDTYPTWVKVTAGHWVTLEQMDGTPDYQAIRTKDRGWWLKWRNSAQPTSGFRTIGEVKDHVKAQQQRIDNR